MALAKIGPPYLVKEVFLSVQGEGVMVGTPMVFVRFSGCNLRCVKEKDGFTCDTSHAYEGGAEHGQGELLKAVQDAGPARWVLLTGGEPTLQVAPDLVDLLHSAGYEVAMESNGTGEAHLLGLDWLTVSPKRGRLRTAWAHEVKHVLAPDQQPQRVDVGRGVTVVSPAFGDDGPLPGAVEWCLKVLRQHPDWRLSAQTHKLLGLR